MPRKNNGFLLIELVVSIAVFTVAIMVGAGLLLSVATAQKKSVSVQAVQDNIGFAFEAMAKEIRTGTNYHCGEYYDDFRTSPRDCDIASGGGLSFVFVNHLGETVVYRATAGLSGQLEKSSDGGDMFLALTSDEVNINNIKFYVYGSSNTDDIQPKVIIILNATAGEKFVTEINLQTALSQRVIDY